MADIIFEGISKIYGDNIKAVVDFNLTIQDKELIVLVGPSGCGKSTTLRMIAGLEDITDGTIRIDGKVVNNIHPKDRDIAMVFQNYALYPHMSVYENMAFALKIRRTPKKEIDEKVKEVAKTLELDGVLKRRPRELSGGQRQRVAMGRAMIRSPKVFLMDEPLSNLDAKLRVQMRIEIANLHKRLQTTFIYVTHDQVEAMTLADRIVVMNEGLIQQVGTPAQIYESPRNIFVASFIGTPQMNLMEGWVEEDHIRLNNGSCLPLTSYAQSSLKDYAGKAVTVGIRSEHITLAAAAEHPHSPVARIKMIDNIGFEKHVYLDFGGIDVVSRYISGVPLNYESDYQVSIASDLISIFDKETGISIRPGAGGAPSGEAVG